MAPSQYTAQLLQDVPYEDRVCRIEHYPGCLSPDLVDEPRATIQQAVDAIADSGRTVPSWPLWDSKMIPRPPEWAEDAERLKEFVEVAHKRGILMLSYYPFIFTTPIHRQHLEWGIQMLDDGGEEVWNEGWLCWNSPYRVATAIPQRDDRVLRPGRGLFRRHELRVPLRCRPAPHGWVHLHLLQGTVPGRDRSRAADKSRHGRRGFPPVCRLALREIQRRCGARGQRRLRKTSGRRLGLELLRPAGAHGCVLEGNLVRDNAAAGDGVGIDVRGGTHDLEIFENRLIDSGAGKQRIGIRVSAEAENAQIERNQFEGMETDCLLRPCASG